ncbi:MAG: hypothetical protein ONA69_01210 [candidate division KSB1 bacterium]|nr:hypothetical protein [candidate division KSB1 bacterium]
MLLPSVFHSPSVVQEFHREAENRLYDIGFGYATLKKSAADSSSLSYDLAGRLIVSSSNWGVLEVPKALADGIFDALQVQGAEKPYDFLGNDRPARSHIVVFRPEEIKSLGGPDRITERGHFFHYTLGPIRQISDKTESKDISKIWYVEVRSPELEKLRKSYGLSARPNVLPFHIVVAVRRRHILRENGIAKQAFVRDITGLLWQLLVVPELRRLAARYGYIYTPGSGHVLDRDLAMYTMAQTRRLANSSAERVDSESYENLIYGVLQSLGFDVKNNPEIRQWARQLARDISGLNPFISSFAPELWDKLQGWRGSPATMTRFMYQADVNRRHPVTGERFFDIDESHRNAMEVYRRLYGSVSGPVLTGGLSAGQLGKLYGSALRRGLLSGYLSDPDRLAQRLSGLSSAVVAAEDLLQSAASQPGIGASHESVSGATDSTVQAAAPQGKLPRGL